MTLEEQRDLMVKDTHVSAEIDSKSRSVDSSVSLILDRTQPPPFHSFDNFPEHIQSESLVLRTILYLGLIL